MFVAASSASGWSLYALQIAFMIAVFGAIPFTDAMIVRYVDDRIRSRVSGMRLAVSFGVSSAAVWLLGPVVKAAGFGDVAAADGRNLRDHAGGDRDASRRRAGRRPAVSATVSPPQSPRAAD